MLEPIARVLRQKRAVSSLLGDLAAEVFRVIPADWLRVDLEDQGKLWSRSIKPGQEAVRPGLGEVPRLRSGETEYARPIEGGHEACLLLGIGEPGGRLILRRKASPFADDEMKKLRSIADVLSLGLRARPFEPPPRPRAPFEEETGPMV
jgi:hypothetical protein